MWKRCPISLELTTPQRSWSVQSDCSESELIFYNNSLDNSILDAIHKWIKKVAVFCDLFWSVGAFKQSEVKLKPSFTLEGYRNPSVNLTGNRKKWVCFYLEQILN